PDVTHGALVIADLAWAMPGSGIRFRAGEGVGTVTRPGLALGVAEPAINPAPRAMISETLIELAEANGAPSPDPEVTIAISAGAFATVSTFAQRHFYVRWSRCRLDPAARGAVLAGLGTDPATVAKAAEAESAGASLEFAGYHRAALVEAVARQAREVALATL